MKIKKWATEYKKSIFKQLNNCSLNRKGYIILFFCNQCLTIQILKAFSNKTLCFHIHSFVLKFFGWIETFFTETQCIQEIRRILNLNLRIKFCSFKQESQKHNDMKNQWIIPRFRSEANKYLNSEQNTFRCSKLSPPSMENLIFEFSKSCLTI